MNPVVTGKSGFQRMAGLFLAAALLMASGTGFGQDADDGFNPNANGSVHAITTQADGKILIGGLFGTIGDVARTRVARILTNGRLDTTFDPGIIAGSGVFQPSTGNWKVRLSGADYYELDVPDFLK
ncbi:MAG: delta-60 repeat domain-containing protein [Syntrophales bacterium]|nr:delta-60 repeat domain-containing protein [Syntrophales bacterium]